MLLEKRVQTETFVMTGEKIELHRNTPTHPLTHTRILTRAHTRKVSISIIVVKSFLFLSICFINSIQVVLGSHEKCEPIEPRIFFIVCRFFIK